MAEELRLEATVVDKFSKPLRDLRSRLNDVKPPEHIGKMAAEFQRVENAVKGVSGSITKNLGTAMAGLSIPSLAAVASIGGLVAAVKGFSTATIELRQFQRETGITIGAFKTLKHAASQFGINEDTIGPGLKKFSDNLFDFRRRYGQTYSELVQIAPDFVKKLRESAPDKALDDSLRYIEQVARERGPRVAGILADKLFGSDQFARFGLKGIKPLQDALKAVKSSSDISKSDEDIAVRFAQSVEKLQEAFGKVSKTVGNELAPAFVQVMESTNKFIEANQGKIGTAVKDALDGIATSAKNFDWRAFGQDLTTIGHALARVAKHFDGRTGQRQATGGAIDEIQDNLGKARKRLQDYDKAHPHASSDDPTRRKLTGDVQFLEDRLAKATARGVEMGMDRFFQRQSFTKRKSDDDDKAPRVTEASFGGGDAGGSRRVGGHHGLPEDHPVRRAMRSFRGRSGAGGGKPTEMGNVNFSKNNADAVRQAAKMLGTSPEDLATVIGYETRGTFSPKVWGGAKRSPDGHMAERGHAGDFLGLIQFGHGERAMYGAHEGQSFGEQMKAVVKYLKHRGFKPGMNIYDLYSTINAGRPGRYNASDGYGTVRSHTDEMIAHHRGKALRFLRSGSQGEVPNPMVDGPHPAIKKAIEGIKPPFHAAHPPVPLSLRPYQDIKPGRGDHVIDPTRRVHHGREQMALLRIEIDEHGKIRRTKADGGNLFHKMDVARGRSMIAAASA